MGFGSSGRLLLVNCQVEAGSCYTQCGCHLKHLVKSKGATWGVARAFWLPSGASERRLIRRAPLTPGTLVDIHHTIMIVIIIAKSSKLCQHELIMIVCGPRVHTQFENHTCHAARGPSCHRHRLFPSCGFVRVTVQVTVWGGQLLVATRKNVITCDHTKQRRKRSFRRCFR